MNIVTMQVYNILMGSGFFGKLEVVEVDRPMTMAYEINSKELRLNPTMVEEFIEDGHLSYLYSEEEILNAMVYHELGHFCEFTENPSLIEKAKHHQFNGTFEEYKQFCIERERSAWEIGSQLIDDEYKDVFEELNMRNMRNYENMKLQEGK